MGVTVSTLEEKILVMMLGESLDSIYKKIDKSYAYLDPKTYPLARCESKREQTAIAVVLASHFFNYMD